ncbi:HAD family hydrolase [Extibacter sp. GGCC_0201]|uniref:HAD family hydrolase n=1 Tax=Extibacter sp. GGCC_0201 TaxID=2731209 RepID=UPI001AA0CF2D|nr:HAD family hydrolase [Extibacter sp. GGCC_0201]MBO1722110.1 HAD family hydrolase [Extibacter sp. GGCC_0201]
MKACVFDLDGTLTDTLESLAYSVKATLREMGLEEITTDECRRFVGNGARRLMECALEAAGDKTGSRIDEGMEIYGRIFDANCTYHVTPYDGIPQMITRLRAVGLKLAVLSNKPHVQTVKVVQEIFGDDIFDCVQGQMEGLKRKPDPEGVYKVLERLHTEKEDCLYIGDSEVDVKTACNAGITCIGAAWGFRSREILADAGAEHIIDMPEELLQYV